MIKTQIGGVEIKRTYRPARIICDVITFVLLIIIGKIGLDLTFTAKFLGWTGLLVPLAFPAAGIALCVAYIKLSFRGMRFGRLKITNQNAQKIYEWWTFSMSLVKIPLMLALFNGEFIYRDWAGTGQPIGINIPIIIDVLFAALIVWFSIRRMKALCEVKKPVKNDSAVKVKVKIADDNNDKNKEN